MEHAGLRNVLKEGEEGEYAEYGWSAGGEGEGVEVGRCQGENAEDGRGSDDGWLVKAPSVGECGL